MNEEHLIPWLCFMHYQFAQGADSCHVPNAVHERATELRLLDVYPEHDWQGRQEAGLTKKGKAACDLRDAEFGISYEDAKP